MENVTNKPKGKKIFSIIFNVIFYIIIVLIIVFAFLSVVQKKNNGISFVFGYSPVRVLTKSMVGENEDSFNKNDVIIVKKFTDSDEIIVGKTIITFYANINGITAPNSHRVIDMLVIDGKICYQTKGDNNPEPDRLLVNEEDIIGIYVNKIEKVGYPIEKLQTKTGFLLSVVLPSVLFLIYQMFVFGKIVIDSKVEKEKAILEEQKIQNEIKEKEALELKKRLEELEKKLAASDYAKDK